MDVLTVVKSQWDRIGAVVCAVAGVVLLIVGYHGIADSPYVAEELAYLISGGLGGVFLLGVGATLYISADMHDEWRKLDRIEAAILSLHSDSGGPGRFDDLVGPVAEARASRHRAGSAAGSGTGANQTAAAGMAQRNRPAEADQGRVRAGHVLAMPRELLNQLRLGGVAIGLAFVALMLAYWKAAGTAESRPAFTATASAATVLAIAGVLASFGMVGMRRRLMHRRNLLLAGFVQKAQNSARRATTASGEGELRMPERLLVIPQGRFAHVPGCAMVAGEKTSSVSSSDLPDGVLPCAICTPAAR